MQIEKGAGNIKTDFLKIANFLKIGRKMKKRARSTKKMPQNNVRRYNKTNSMAKIRKNTQRSSSNYSKISNTKNSKANKASKASEKIHSRKSSTGSEFDGEIINLGMNAVDSFIGLQLNRKFKQSLGELDLHPRNLDVTFLNNMARS